MNFIDTVKAVVFNKYATKAAEISAEALVTEPKSTTENPYLTARRSWNEHVGAVVSSRQTWQVVGILSLLIALASVGGIVYIGSQSKFVPYVIEVDKLGQTAAIAPARAASSADKRVIEASVASFIADARLVTPDVALQRKAIFRVYSMLAANDPAAAKMTEWFSATEESKPFARAKQETVSIEITSALPQTPDTWQVDWIETIRDRQGLLKGQPFRMRALVTVYIARPTNKTTEEQIRDNPLGIFVRDFSWSKQL